MGAKSSPHQLLFSSEAITPEAKAPARSCPSIAILITPERSDSTPAIAPKISGTESSKPPCKRPVRGMNFPAAAQQRKDIRNVDPKTRLMTLECFLIVKRPNATSAVTTDRTAKSKAPDLESTTHFSSSTHSLPKIKPYVTGWLLSGRSAKTTSAKIPSTPIVITPRNFRLSGTDIVRKLIFAISHSIPSKRLSLLGLDSLI